MSRYFWLYVYSYLNVGLFLIIYLNVRIFLIIYLNVGIFLIICIPECKNISDYSIYLNVVIFLITYIQYLNVGIFLILHLNVRIFLILHLNVRIFLILYLNVRIFLILYLNVGIFLHDSPGPKVQHLQGSHGVHCMNQQPSAARVNGEPADGVRHSILPFQTPLPCPRNLAIIPCGYLLAGYCTK